ncbi:amino acid permease [Altererythrobacter indicus]|uniref:Amino acid permease n=1 Tax=Altericroceibacterium indicum TaxID=374177 RepID=A0A845A3R1_9SPHN|nr:APC family permease [Altericroceibacterium indicum]MXP24902.1 amino acid permease [Altericroceibacterium indicum]
MSVNKGRAGASSPAMGLGGAWAMAVGGMIGGGIFSTLGVVISVAGQWAWISFLIGGLVALASGHSYAVLTTRFEKSGGSYAYLMETGWPRVARAVAWTLVIGYTLTISVYAETFGAYAAYAIGAPHWVTKAAAILAIVVLLGVNLRGASEATSLEIFVVWGKLVILLGLAGLGIYHWAPDNLHFDQEHPVGIGEAFIGMGVVFMAYEGFQLLSYDYNEMRDPSRTISRAMPLAIIVTTITYMVVAVGAGMLAGASNIVAEKEVSLALAGRQALGSFGFIAVSIAAVFSAGSAINATIFATARLAEGAAQDGNMPKLFAKRDTRNVPWFGVSIISAGAILLVLMGEIASLVEGASFVFLLIFALVNFIALSLKVRRRWISVLGLLGSIAGAVMLVLYQIGVV